MKNKVSLIRILLIPFSLLYSFIMKIRNYLYDNKYFKICRTDAKVISVGNITTGGTGKTPMVIYLAGMFIKKGKKVGIISRGYGRRSKDMITVCNGHEIVNDIALTGDEPALISFELLKEHKGEFCVVAYSDRCTAEKFIKDNFNPDVIILDDAFQNRRVFRDKDLVMIDVNDLIQNKFFYKYTIPSGNLRENFSGLKRADLIIANCKETVDKYTEDEINNFSFPAPVIKIRYKTEYLINHKNTILKPEKNKAVIISGIAAPASFIESVKMKGIEIKREFIFKDHHDYSKKDIDKFIAVFENDLIYITTGKDFMKIRNYKYFIENFPVYYSSMKIEVTENSDLLENLI